MTDEATTNETPAPARRERRFMVATAATPDGIHVICTPMQACLDRETALKVARGYVKLADMINSSVAKYDDGDFDEMRDDDPEDDVPVDDDAPNEEPTP